MRNKCNTCGKPVGNITFSVCDECWDKEDDRLWGEYVERLEPSDELV